MLVSLGYHHMIFDNVSKESISIPVYHTFFFYTILGKSNGDSQIDLRKQPQPLPPLTSSRSKASAPTVNLKLGRSRPKAIAFQDIWNIDSKIDLKHQPKSDLETQALLQSTS